MGIISVGKQRLHALAGAGTDKRTKQAGGGRWWPLRDRAGFGWGGWLRLWGDGAAQGLREALERTFQGGKKKVGKSFCFVEAKLGMRSEEKPRSEVVAVCETLTGERWELFISVRTFFQEQHREN